MVVVFEFLSTLLTMVQCVPAVREQRRIGTSGVFQRTLIVAIFEQGSCHLDECLFHAESRTPRHSLLLVRWQSPALVFSHRRRSFVSVFTVTALILNYVRVES